MSPSPDQKLDAETIETGVRHILAEELGVELSAIRSDTNIADALGADALDMESMKVATEHRFHIKISDENWKKMRLVCDIVHLVDVYLEIKQIEM